jgi:hypothetical protein
MIIQMFQAYRINNPVITRKLHGTHSETGRVHEVAKGTLPYKYYYYKCYFSEFFYFQNYSKSDLFWFSVFFVHSLLLHYPFLSFSLSLSNLPYVSSGNYIWFIFYKLSVWVYPLIPQHCYRYIVTYQFRCVPIPLLCCSEAQWFAYSIMKLCTKSVMSH